MSQEPETPAAATPGSKVDLQSTVKLVSEQALPLEVGSVEVNDDGTLRARDSELPLDFTFNFLDIDFEVRVGGGNDGSLQVAATVGRLPYTAENGWARQFLGKVLTAASRLRRSRLTVDKQNRIVLRGEAVPPAPRTPMSVMATLTALVVEAKPYLEIIVEALALERAPAAKR